MLANNHVKVLEKHLYDTPLGIRFWDPVLDQQITKPLNVYATLQTNPQRRVKAVATYSNNYAFHRLPGWFGNDMVASPSGTQAYIISVTDPEACYSPAAMLTQAPQQGLLPLGENNASPAVKLPGIYLFSAATRAVPKWLAAVRATIIDGDSGFPAEYAVLQVNVAGGNSYFGIAQENGEVLVLLPYPTTSSPFANSPAGAGGMDLLNQSWIVSVQVLYAPGQLQFYAQVDLPDYASLWSQGFANLQLHTSGNLTQQIDTELLFNRQLVIKTQAEEQGRLVIFAS